MPTRVNANDSEIADDPVAIAMRAGREESGVARAQALAELERRMFGRRAPRTIGRYVIGDAIGRGAQGTVWIGRDPELDRDVAIKLIHASRRFDAAGHARLRREAQTLARIEHPNVLGVLDIGEHDGLLFMVTPLVGGADLRTWLAAATRSSEERVAVIRDVAAGLVAVHAIGLLHRDIKPPNVLVGPDGRGLLADFGLACGGELERAITQDGTADPVRTDQGVVVGTPAYLAPEQHAGGPASEATDRFALCVTAWEVLFGSRPFVGDSLEAIANAKLHGHVPAPPHNTVPPALVRVLQRGLATDPRKRHRSTAELLAAIDDALRPRRAWVAAAALAAITGVLGWPAPATELASDDPCSEVAAEWAQTWSPDRRASFASALAAPFLTDTTAAVDAYLEEFGTGWREHACTSARAVAHSDHGDARSALRCLTGLRDALRETIDAHARADPGRQATVLEALRSHGRPEDCVGPMRLPPEHDQMLAVADARALLARSRSRSRRGDPEGAATDLDAAAALAEQTAFAPLSAEVELLRASVQQRNDEIDAALRSLLRAHDLALASRHDRIVAEAAVELAHHHVAGHTDLRQASRWIRDAEAALERIGGPTTRPALAARLHIVESKLAAAVGDWHGALDAADQAVALVDGVVGSELALALALQERGVAHWKLDHTDAAMDDFRRVLAIQRAALGHWHPATAIALGNLAAPLLDDDENFDTAIPLLREAIMIRSQAGRANDLQTAQYWISLATALRLRGDLDLARNAAELAIAMLEARLGPSDPRIALALRARADVDLDAGDWASAAAHYGRAVVQYDEVGGDPSDLGWALHKLGLAQRQAGELEAARRTYVRALAVRTESVASNVVAIAYSHLLVADVEAASGAAASARAHARSGLALLDTDPQLRPLARWVDARVELALGERAAARAQLRRAITELVEAGVATSAVDASVELARLEQRAGNRPAAQAALRDAAEHATAPSQRTRRSELVVLGLAGPRPITPAQIAQARRAAHP
jgi:eukaryotic-like serine/threonine-protein kinase